MTNPTNIDTAINISLSIDKLYTESSKRGAFELNPDVVSGWVEMALGALDVLVTAKRGKYPHDPALQQTIEEHLRHARDHADTAYDVCHADDDCTRSGCGLDDDGLPHLHHATARVALALTRKAIVEREKVARPKVTFEVDPTDAFAALGRVQDSIANAIISQETRRHCHDACKASMVELDKGQVIKAYHEVLDGIIDRIHENRERRVDEFDEALTRSLQREGLADASGNAIPFVPKSEKKPVVVIGMDGGDCYRATAPVERKCDNSCVPNGTVLIGGTRYRPTHGFAKVGTGTGYCDGVACGVIGCDAASPLKTVTCKSDGCVTITSHEQCAKLLGGSHPLSSPDVRVWRRRPVSVLVNGKPFAPTIHQTRIGTAVDSVRAGDVVAVESKTNWQPQPPAYVTVDDLRGMEWYHKVWCSGCAWAKWIGGPGYSQRCDGCKSDQNRPSYEAKR